MQWEEAPAVEEDRSEPELNKGHNMNQTVTSTSVLGLNFHGKDPDPVSEEDQSSDEESEVSDTGSEARAGRRARVRRAEDEGSDDNKDQLDELEPWVVPEQKERDDSGAKDHGSPSHQNDTSGRDNQPTNANANANTNVGDLVAAPSTSQTQTDGANAHNQTSKPPRSKGDKIKGEKKEKKDKKEGSSKTKQPKPKAPKPKPAEEGDEADVAKVDEGDSKGKSKRPGGYINHERVKTGGSERVSSHTGLEITPLTIFTD